MSEKASAFKLRLIKKTGLAARAVDLAWPEWWSDAADASASAHAELRFTLARKLGLDPSSLLDNASPRFLWQDETKFKNFTGKRGKEEPAVGGFGAAVGRMLVVCCPTYQALDNVTAAMLRDMLLKHLPFIQFGDLLALCWTLGVPVIHLRVFPLKVKRMCAMATRVGDRYAILLAHDANYPPFSAFHLAHELAHIFLGHLRDRASLIDIDDPLHRKSSDDREEKEADAFALELLTGTAELSIIAVGEGRSATQLARYALQMTAHGIEPGAFALCYGYSTGNWQTANAAIAIIYKEKKPVWYEVNKVAMSQLAFHQLPDDSSLFLRAVLGGLQQSESSSA